MLCAGATVYAPLKHFGAKGNKVAIIGIGGLGHFGIMFAKALGAEEVVAISRGSDKKPDALALGATGHIATSEEGWAEKNKRRFDLIISTADGANVSHHSLTYCDHHVNLSDAMGPIPWAVENGRYNGLRRRTRKAHPHQHILPASHQGQVHVHTDCKPERAARDASAGGR